MLAIERRNRIVSIIQEKNSVMVTDLSKMFGVTEETIRKDLEKLEREGLLKRTYGGAVLNESLNTELPLKYREETNVSGKRAIANKVIEFIEDGDTIMMDSSSTALYIAKELKTRKKNITVITNSVRIVMELSMNVNIKIMSTGGNLSHRSMSFVGPLAQKVLNNYNVDKAIICCKGVDRERGITESNEMEAEIKKSMMNSAKKVYLVVDSTKFDKVSFTQMLQFDDVDAVFTDNNLSDEWMQVLNRASVKPFDALTLK